MKIASIARCLGVLVIGMLFVGVGGCQGPPHEGKSDYVSPQAYPRVSVEGDLADWLVFGKATIEPSSGNKPMHVIQATRNSGNDHINVQYRFEFFDADGRPLDTSPKWQFVEMSPRTEIFMEGSAMELRATDWRLVVRSAR